MQYLFYFISDARFYPLFFQDNISARMLGLGLGLGFKAIVALALKLMAALALPFWLWLCVTLQGQRYYQLKSYNFISYYHNAER